MNNRRSLFVSNLCIFLLLLGLQAIDWPAWAETGLYLLAMWVGISTVKTGIYWLKNLNSH